MTNGEKIRTMTDEELADLLASGDCYSCMVEKENGSDCHECALKWLKKDE